MTLTVLIDSLYLCYTDVTAIGTELSRGLNPMHLQGNGFADTLQLV